MPFFKRQFQEILADTIEDLSRNTAITKLSPGGKARAILETVSKRLEEQYRLFDKNLARAFVSTAQGQFLDLIGELVGLSREPSDVASVTSNMEVLRFSVEDGNTFGSINAGQDIILSAGRHRISTKPNGNGIVYIINETVVLSAGATEGFVSAIAASPGVTANVGAHSLVFHTFTDYVDYQNNTLKITNLHAIGNGKNFEGDANFKFRIVNRVLEAEAGNEIAIRLAALSTPGVADVFISKHYRGIGTFGVLIKSTIPTVSDDLINAVTFNVLQVTTLGELGFIRKPKETGLAMRITVHYFSRLSDDEIEAIENNLLDTITNHVNNLDLGQSFEVNRLVSDMFDVSQSIANFGEPGVPIDEIFLYRESRVQDNKTRESLLGNYNPTSDERVIIEPSNSNPIIFSRAFDRN